jgi:hypothetical protein
MLIRFAGKPTDRAGLDEQAAVATLWRALCVEVRNAE